MEENQVLYLIVWYVPPLQSSLHMPGSRTLHEQGFKCVCSILYRLQKFLLLAIDYSILSLLKQQGSEPFSTAFDQAAAHQEDKSKWYLQNQMPMFHASQQHSPSVMTFAQHAFPKQSNSWVCVIGSSQQVTCLDKDLVFQRPLLVPTSKARRTSSDNGIAVLNRILWKNLYFF